MKRNGNTFHLLILASMLLSLTACGETGKESSRQTTDRHAGRPTEQDQPQTVAQSGAHRPGFRPTFGIGLPAPDFGLRDIRGREVTLSEHKGKAVVVSFWATWCSPCRMVMPHLQALAKQYPDQLAVLGISLDQEPQRVVPSFADRFGLTFTLLADPRAFMVAQEWGGVSSVPTAYLIDAEGLVVERWVGAKSLQDYETRVRRVLGLDS